MNLPLVVGFVESMAWQLVDSLMERAYGVDVQHIVVSHISNACCLLLQDLVKTATQLWFPAPSDAEMYAAAPFYDVDEVLCRQLMFR
jgi:hypothetical protein